MNMQLKYTKQAEIQKKHTHNNDNDNKLNVLFFPLYLGYGCISSVYVCRMDVVLCDSKA